MIVPFLDSLVLVSILLWIYLFLGGCMLPLLTLCILGVIEPELRPPAYALANFLYNFLGYLPAPYIYGLVSEMTGGKTSRWGMVVTMFINIPVALSIALAIYYKKNT